MKKKLLFILSILIFGSCTINAQGKSDKQKLVGIRAGYQISYMVNDGSIPDSANGLDWFYVGLYRDQRVNKIFSYGAGLEYFQNGLTYPNNSERVQNTLSIPIHLKLKIGPVFAVGGIATNFKLTEKYEVGDNTYQPTDTSNSNWIDFAAFAGVGVKIFFITVEARYHWGLLEVRDGLNNRYLQIGAAFNL
jgi:hypothetical protein